MIHSSTATSSTRKRSANQELIQKSGADRPQSPSRQNSPHPADQLNTDIARNIIGAHALTREPIARGRDLGQLLDTSSQPSASNSPIGQLICSPQYPALAAAYENAAELVTELEELAAAERWLNVNKGDEFAHSPVLPERYELTMLEPEPSTEQPEQAHPIDEQTLPRDFVR
ncbi:MAG: hypothetical protein EOO22_05200, partial [Comamonadaceae bacterium]